MPQKWSPAEHEELLIHVMRTHQIKWDQVANDWRKEKGEAAPTHGAITQHLAKWKKGNGGPKNKVPANIKKDSVPSTPKTPKVATPVHKTPSTGTKRKATTMSDDDDDDSEPDVNAEVGVRTSLPRRSKSKSIPPSVAYEAAFDSDNEDGGDVNGEVSDSQESNKRRKQPCRALDRDSDGDSDMSDFAKAFK